MKTNNNMQRTIENILNGPLLHHFASTFPAHCAHFSSAFGVLRFHFSVRGGLGLESEIPTATRRTPEAVDESASQRRQLLAVQNRLISQQNSLLAAVDTSEQEKAKHREEAHSYILQLRSFGCFSIVARFRIRMLFRIHRSELKREVQELCLSRIASTLESMDGRLKL